MEAVWEGKQRELCGKTTETVYDVSTIHLVVGTYYTSIVYDMYMKPLFARVHHGISVGWACVLCSPTAEKPV